MRRNCAPTESEPSPAQRSTAQSSTEPHLGKQRVQRSVRSGVGRQQLQQRAGLGRPGRRQQQRGKGVHQVAELWGQKEGRRK